MQGFRCNEGTSLHLQTCCACVVDSNIRILLFCGRPVHTSFCILWNVYPRDKQLKNTLFTVWSTLECSDSLGISAASTAHTFFVLNKEIGKTHFCCCCCGGVPKKYRYFTVDVPVDVEAIYVSDEISVVYDFIVVASVECLDFIIWVVRYRIVDEFQRLLLFIYTLFGVTLDPILQRFIINDNHKSFEVRWEEFLFRYIILSLM